MGMFGGLNAEAYDRSYTDRALLARIFTYFGAFRSRMITLAAVTIFMAILGALNPLLVSSGVQSMVQARSDLYLVGLILVVLIVGVLSWLGNLVRRRLTAVVTGDVVLALRSDAFNASVKHDLSFYDEFKTGKIVSRITSDTQEFAQMVTLVTDVISQVLTVLILLPILFSIEWRLTLAMLAMTPVAYFTASAFRSLARRTTRQGFRAMGEVNASVQEAVTGISIAKNFRQEASLYNRFVDINNISYRVNLKRGFVLSNVFPVLNALTGIGTAILVYFGGLAAASGDISIGAWYLFVASLDRFWFPIINIAAFWSQFQAGLSAAERVFALIDAEPVVRQTDQISAPTLRGGIAFDRVNFRYSPQEAVLNDFSLDIRAGETLALVGHTGAGKSSIAKLIARFYEFQSGSILIDGQDVRSFELNSYRKQLGIVSQTPFLFAGTVIDNIRYANADISDREIETIARQVGEGEWLDVLPNGLQTEVGQRGSRLSMGQRQLVALMRVLAQRPAIFILDEATASIDPFTESQIKDALDLILAKSTSILIAHRLSTVKTADRTIVLRAGRIIEEGSHDQLMRRGGHYAELYNTYFRHQSLDAIETKPAAKFTFAAAESSS
jgi:ATP-binding cassette, subfamily B, bacterial